MSDLCEKSVVELGALVRGREVSPTEVVEAHISRIEATNGALNAVVADRFEAARAEARAQTERWPADPPPLFGVPCTVKEFVAVEGQPHTGGVLAHARRRATADATVVRRLRDAGAIVLGATNAPEGGLWHETNNPIYGRTHNPWDLHRTPGGSSGGEGAILAAGGAPFGIGSDVGGSIRLPAALCGIAGHKPSGGLIPNTGHFPPAPDLDVAALCVGPMARRASDLGLLTRVMAGPDGVDPRCRPLPFGDPAAVDLRGLRVLALETNGRSPVRPEIAAAVNRVAFALRERGATLIEAPLPGLKWGFEIWAAALSSGPATLRDIVGEHRGVRSFADLVRFPLGRARHAGGVLVMLLLERLLEAVPFDPSRLMALRDGLRAALDQTLGDDGVLVLPAFPRTAPRHRGMALGRPWDVGYTAVFNVTESPVTVVPVDTDPRGLPIGVQIVGAHGRDHLTIGAAMAVEEAFGGWIRPVEPRWGRALPLGLRLVRRHRPLTA